MTNITPSSIPAMGQLIMPLETELSAKLLGAKGAAMEEGCD